MAMVRSVNKVLLTGRVGSVYERKPLPNNKPGPLNISIATQEIFTGNKQRTDWHKITLWGATADFVEKYVGVGALVHVEGALRTVQKTNPDGSTSAYVNIEGHQLTLLVNSPRDAKQQEERKGAPEDEDGEPEDDEPGDGPDDDIPF
jgi:single-strand DNA-binding protein